MLAWTKQNTMQRAMRTVLEWPQSHATHKTINMITNKYEPQQKCRLGTVSKKILGGLNRYYGYPTSPSASGSPVASLVAVVLFRLNAMMFSHPI